MEACKKIIVDLPNSLVEPARKRSNGHFVSVTVEDVIVAIGNLDKDVWTTRDVAAALAVKERAIRATIRQLKRRGLIREAGKVQRVTRETAREYYPMAYEIVLTWGKADFGTLNRVFCHG